MCAMELKKRVPDKEGQICFAWPAPAPYYAMRSIIDPRVLEGDRERTDDQGVGGRMSNLQFKASRTL